jgi:hypothetical protein
MPSVISAARMQASVMMAKALLMTCSPVDFSDHVTGMEATL